ncbi:YggS family pyridoxal phosphate-dependent enzyme [[Bacteroides] pectinophilus]|uniref:Pyridoxal phosphate homeostasis protein n=1 Tax=[Bacteroides] pectinophilus ATCC 43243 TaxID=483218 RepID=B7ANS4_9FIRM|nr:pyridoxal phosphate enzyme, YggS family [[Bacteroides] pectinophilus ATCC 43243]MEE0058886.1 YggS family pyridoxal phosphate-dependent enzyme [[Bacteroides] pectinophilus]UWN94414.1 YggS family pyridoxal phosphate-dependent enzyme [[Bacteroides] pectinophilus]
MLSDNLHEVQENIRKACERSGRNPEDVTLIAVSKTKPVSDIEQIYAAGIREFGENKVQEMNDKQKVLPGDINWHMIGHLQRNKVKYIVDNVAMIHSVDSVRLAEEISKEAVKKNVAVDILVEVNVAKEESKFGLYTEDVGQFVEQISKLPGINIKGLMTSAPFVDNPEDNRQYFKKLKDLSVDINAKNIDNVHMDFLSMGMTNDYVVAVEEGATHVRVGTAIFGHRDYNI